MRQLRAAAVDDAHDVDVEDPSPVRGRGLEQVAGDISGNIFTDTWNANLTWGMACNMTGGSSGGPWLSSFTESSGVGTLSSLNSYGYSGVKNMYGPKFNSDTQAVYQAADGATGNTLVP